MAAVLGAAAASDVCAESDASLRVERTEFRLTLPDGRVLGSRELIGAVLTLETHQGSLAVRIDAVESDPAHAAGEILLHRLSTRQADGSWAELCLPDPDRRRLAFPLAGRSLPDGKIVPAPGRIELVCTSGAQGKCVRFGYKPWKTAPDGRTLLDFLNACVRMMRADYCGDGTATTRDGTLIDHYDRIGIQKPDLAPDMEFEAAWSPEGAVCVHHPRIRENLTLDRLAASCPRLRERLGPACDEHAGARLGGLVFNRSYP